MSTTRYQIEQQILALVEGRLSCGEDIERAFISVAHAIWSGAYHPHDSLESLDSVGQRRLGYLMETLKLFSHNREVCRMLDELIHRTQNGLQAAEIDVGFLPVQVEKHLVETDDELAEYWGLRSGIKVHQVPGFLAAFFSGQRQSTEPALAPCQLH